MIMKLIEDKSSKYLARFLIVALPGLFVPIVVYDYVVSFFGHDWTVWGGMILGFIIGALLVLSIDKIPRRKKKYESTTKTDS